jgi:diguanylate cyclase (GGDEF)-like protein
MRLFSALRIPVGQGLSGWVAATGKPMINGNPSVEPGYLNDPSKFSTLRSALAIPLENAAGVTGVLALYHLGSDAFNHDHLRVLLALKPKVSLIVENALERARAEISAAKDGLTSLPNASSLFLHLEGELERCQRTNSALAVLVGDLDGFKQVNDRFGYLEGNKVLKLVAAGLNECCRQDDYLARMGGDEFVLVLPGFKIEHLSKKLLAIEEVAVESGLAVCGERLLDISVGAVFYPEDGADAEGLLAEAERRMYLVKRRLKQAVPSEGSGLANLAAQIEESAVCAPHSTLLQ